MSPSLADKIETGRLHINRPRWTAAFRKSMRCPTCAKRTPHVGFFQDWYGWTIACLRCGDSWTDGEMHPRPFMPRWRQRAIESFERMWKRWKETRRA